MVGLTLSGQGNMFGTEYKDTIDGLKKDFDRDMKAFDRSVSLETFKTVGRIDETVHTIRECAQHFCIATVASSARHRISRRTDYRPRISEGKIGRSRNRPLRLEQGMPGRNTNGSTG